MYRVNMNSIPGEVVEAIHRELDRIDRDAVHFSYKSVHYDDKYLFVCIGRLQKYDECEVGIYSVHTYNSSSGALNNGRRKAQRGFLRRVRGTQKVEDS